MKKYSNIDEAHHSYSDIDYKTEFKEIKLDDSITMYHGFRDAQDAVSFARYGFSGKVRANRNYSYESDNNPFGLFVTLSQKVATQFAGAHGKDQIIMEFIADVSQLEAPVWPNGTYTIPGQMAGYFGRGAKGNANRKAAQRAAEADPGSSLPHVAQSDRKHLATTLTASSEYQALFVGHLSPDKIVAFHIRPGGENYNYQNSWQRITREEFLERYADKPLKNDDRADMRVYGPDDTFVGDEFLSRMSAKYGGERKRDLEKNIGSIWATVLDSKNKAFAFRDAFENYLWPKQMVPAMNWMRGHYRGVDLNEGATNFIFVRGWYRPSTGEFIKLDTYDSHEDVVLFEPHTFGIASLKQSDDPITKACENGWVRFGNFNGYFSQDGGYIQGLNVYLVRRGLAMMEKKNYLPDTIAVEIQDPEMLFDLDMEQIDSFIQSCRIPKSY